jgi:hypothetical protein
MNDELESGIPHSSLSVQNFEEPPGIHAAESGDNGD